MEDQFDIVHEIAGKKYVLFQTELAFNSFGMRTAGKYAEKIAELNGIEIYIKHVGFWHQRIAMKFLIPEESAVEFSKYEPSIF